MDTQEVAEGLGVSYQTVVNYTQRHDDPLPVMEKRQGFRTIRTYDSTTVKAWAKRNNIPCTIQ